MAFKYDEEYLKLILLYSLSSTFGNIRDTILYGCDPLILYERNLHLYLNYLLIALPQLLFIKRLHKRHSMTLLLVTLIFGHLTYDHVDNGKVESGFIKCVFLSYNMEQEM